MWIKDGVHFKFNSGQFSGLPTELPTISIFESSGLPTELLTDLPTLLVYGSSWQPNLNGKIPMGNPWAAHSTAHFFIFGSSGLLLSCPLFPYMEVVGSLIYIAKFPWAAHGQPTPLPTCSPWAAKWAAPLFFSVWDGVHFKFNSGQFSGLPTELPTISIFESSGLPTELSTELPTLLVYGSSGQPNLHGKIPMGSPLRYPLSCPLFYIWKQWAATELPTELSNVSIYGSSGQSNLHGKIIMGNPRAAHSVAHVQPMGSEVGSSPVFSVWAFIDIRQVRPITISLWIETPDYRFR